MDTYIQKIVIKQRDDANYFGYSYPTEILMSDGVTEVIDWADKHSRKNALNNVVSATRFVDNR